MTVDVGHPLLLACRGEPAEHVPVWFMRQAGRSLPEYQKVRESHSLLDICHEPELTAEVTLQPVDRLGVDAAILFSDIVVPLLGVGIDVRLVDGVGPVIDDPIASAADLQRLRPLQPSEDVPYVAEAVRLIVKEAAVPLIGFAGAPFTLACYLIEGGPSKDKARTKALMLGEPDLWSDLMGRLAGIVGALLRAQVEAGAQVVQLFDSWAGWLTPADYAARVAPYSRSILTGLDDLGVPRIHFGVNTGELLGEMKDAGADVVGVDWRTPLDAARRRLGPDVPVQGNLDPAACLAPSEIVAAKVADVLQRGGGRGHIFNLGHGVLPQTDPDTLARVVELVHGWAPS